MKRNGHKKSSIAFSALGLLSMLVAVAAISWGLQAEPVILQEPEMARQCAEGFVNAVNAGDLTAAAEFFPEPATLGAVAADADPVVALVWDAHCAQLGAKAVSGLYTTSKGLSMDLELTSMVVDSTMEEIGALSVKQMQACIANASDMAEVYDDNGQFHPELVDDMLQQTARELLAQELPVETASITIHLTQIDGSWKIVPDTALINILSGRS